MPQSAVESASCGFLLKDRHKVTAVFFEQHEKLQSRRRQVGVCSINQVVARVDVEIFYVDINEQTVFNIFNGSQFR